MLINVIRVDRYRTIAGTFLFVSALIIYHESRTVLLKYHQEHLKSFRNDSEQFVVYNDDLTCNCHNSYRSFRPSVIQSTCSYDSDLRGFNQSVVSYTLFGHPNQNEQVQRRYFATLEGRVVRIGRYYSDWIMRIYHNLTASQVSSYLCPLQCRYPKIVDLCHVDKIRHEEINPAIIHRLNPRMWRFLVMLDPLVDRFLSRDVDSEIIPREVAAVKQWLKSNYTFHVMRDHPSHGGFMLAGLWGAKNIQRRDLLRRLGKTMMLTSMNGDYQTDQNRLDLFVWPFATFDVMAHDAYFCNNWKLQIAAMLPTYPFPTRRVGRNYTGLDIVRTDIADHIVPCPVQCRPANHKNWLFC